MSKQKKPSEVARLNAAAEKYMRLILHLQQVKDDLEMEIEIRRRMLETEEYRLIARANVMNQTVKLDDWLQRHEGV